jgi:hypothetical protein
MPLWNLRLLQNVLRVVQRTRLVPTVHDVYILRYD